MNSRNDAGTCDFPFWISRGKELKSSLIIRFNKSMISVVSKNERHSGGMISSYVFGSWVKKSRMWTPPQKVWKRRDEVAKVRRESMYSFAEANSLENGRGWDGGIFAMLRIFGWLFYISTFRFSFFSKVNSAIFSGSSNLKHR